MKKIILTIAIACSISVGFAQTALQKAKAAATTGTAVASALGVSTTDVVSTLTSKLTLSKIQKPKVLAAVSKFAAAKSKITSLAQTDNAAYTSKLSGLQSTLFSSLKSSLSATQYTKFLGLKPETATKANALSALFF